MRVNNRRDRSDRNRQGEVSTPACSSRSQSWMGATKSAAAERGNKVGRRLLRMPN